MDHKLTSFAEIYALAAPVPVPAAAAAGRASMLSRMTGAVGRGAQAARSMFQYSPKAKQLAGYEGAQARVFVSPKTNRLVVDEGALAREGFSISDIRGAKNLAWKKFYEGKSLAKTQQLQASVKRQVQAAKSMYMKLITAPGIKGMWDRASPTMKKAVLVSSGLTVLYMLFSGKKPAGASEESKTIISSIEQNPSPIIPELIPRIDSVIQIANDKPDVIQALNNAKVSVTALNNAPLNLDDPVSGAAFSKAIKEAENAIGAALQLLDGLEQSAQDPQDLEKIQLLQGAFGEFLLEVIAVREQA